MVWLLLRCVYQKVRLWTNGDKPRECGLAPVLERHCCARRWRSAGKHELVTSEQEGAVEWFLYRDAGAEHLFLKAEALHPVLFIIMTAIQQTSSPLQRPLTDSRQSKLYQSNLSGWSWQEEGLKTPASPHRQAEILWSELESSICLQEDVEMWHV